MVNFPLQALCLVAAARSGMAMPTEDAAAVAGQDSSQWPMSELILESPFEHHRRLAERATDKLMEANSARQAQACMAETPVGMGPTISPDTVAAFQSYDAFKNNASATGMSNSAFVVSVVNAPASFQYSGNTNLGWMSMAAYSPSTCQMACQSLNATGVRCNTYNTYYLRSPTVMPSYDSSCPNPPSMTTIVCSLWKNKLYPWDAVNTGELRGRNFTVVVAGSNLFQRNNTDLF